MLQRLQQQKKDGSWKALDAIEALIIPEDLKQALESNEAAKRNFEGFNKSSKKSILFWISNAKREQTRLKRIEKTVNSAAENKNPLA